MNYSKFSLMTCKLVTTRSSIDDIAQGYRPSALLLNAGCNEQVFSPKPWKKKNLAQIRLVVRDKRTFNSEKWCHRAEG